MQNDFKKEVWKVLKVAIFLFFSIVVILPYVIQISVYFHERAHINVLSKYGIEASYEANFLRAIPNFFSSKLLALGVTKFDRGKYLELDKYQRMEVNTAGIVSDLTILFLLGVYLSFVNIYIFYKMNIKKDKRIVFALAINWILFMWLMVLIQITIANIVYDSGDIYHLVKFLG